MPTDQEFWNVYISLTESPIGPDQAYHRMLAAWHAAERPANIRGFIQSCLRLSSLGVLSRT